MSEVQLGAPMEMTVAANELLFMNRDNARTAEGFASDLSRAIRPRYLWAPHREGRAVVPHRRTEEER